MDWARQLGFDALERKHGLPFGLLSAVMQAESAGDPKAVSEAGAQGLFQFMPKTAQGYGIDPFDPAQAADGAARMYGDLNRQYKGDLPKMLAAYNWGSGNLDENGLDNAPEETRNYVAKVQGFLPSSGGSSAPTMMGSGAFDDLIPSANDSVKSAPSTAQASVSNGAFDDLIPQAPAGQESAAAAQPSMPAKPPLKAEVAPPSTMEREARGFKIGSQGVGRGMADLIGMPVDLTTLALNAGISGLNSLGADKLIDGGISTIKNPLLGSDYIANTSAALAEKLGMNLEDYEKLAPAEKLAYNVNRFGASAATGGLGLAKSVAAEAPAAARLALTPKADVGAAERVAQKFIEPMKEAYRANPGRALFVDTMAGVGSGTGVTAAEQIAPDSPIAVLIGSVLGGAGGATAGGTAVALKNGAGSIGKAIKQGLGFESGNPVDPTTGIPVSNSVANKAATYVQGKAENPAQAAKNIEENAKFYRENNLPLPTTGVLSKDRGAVGVERRIRTEAPTPFISSDEKLRGAQGELLQKMGPNIPEANKRDAQAFAEQTANAMRGEAEIAAKNARNDLTQGQNKLDAAKEREAQIASPIAAQRGTEGKASQQLDKEIVEGALQPRTRAKNEAFDAIDPQRSVQRDAMPVIDTAREIQASIGKLSPESSGVPAEFMQKLNKLAPKIVTKEGGMDYATGKPTVINENIGGDGTVSLGDMLDARKYLNTAAEKAQQQGNFELATNIRKLKKEINNELDKTIVDGSPSVSKLAADAKKAYEEEYAPYFAEGFGRNFRDKIQRDPTNRTALPPSQSADFFLNNSDEAAKDLSRIVSVAKNPTAATDAVGNYMKAQLAQLVKADGTLEPATMRKWLDNNQAALGQFPSVKGDLEGFYKDVLNGRAQRNAMQTQVRALADNLRAAEGNVGATERRINSSVLKTLIDNEPQNAAGAILSGKDPEREMERTLAVLGKNNGARDAFKRAVADHLANRFTNTRTELTPDQTYSVMQSYVESTMKKPGVQQALTKLYADAPDAMNNLRLAQRIGRDMARLNVKATAESATAELTAGRSAGLAPLELALKHFLGNLEGGGRMRQLKLAINTIPGLNSDAAVSNLVLRAQFDPELAAHLYSRDASKVPARLWTKKLNRLLGYSAFSREISDDDNTE